MMMLNVTQKVSAICLHLTGTIRNKIEISIVAKESIRIV
jgi:hypothetical protein